jgi:hypothetical protein
MFYKHRKDTPIWKNIEIETMGGKLNHLNLFFSINVACVLDDEVEVIWQIWKNMKNCSMEK